MEHLECSILRSMVEYPQEIDEFLAKLPMEIFSKEARTILEPINELASKGILDITSLDSSLSEEFKNSEWYVDFLSGEINPNYLHYKEIFVQNYRLKVQNAIAQKLLKASSAGQIIDIDTLITHTSVQEEFRNFNQWQEYLNTKPPLPKFKSHIEFLDSCFDNGFEGGQLILISGDPEAGKTMLGTQIIENIAKSHKVAFFCFEFTIASYIKAKRHTRLNAGNIILIDDGYNINEIAHNIKELYKQGVSVFLIDSQMRIVSPNGRNMEEEESLKFSTLARLCHSLGIVVFLIVQTSKGDRDNPMGSKKGGHEASIIMRIEHCKAKDENLREFDEGSRMFIVKKNKQSGKHFKEKVRFDAQSLRFSSLEREVDEDAQKLDIDEIQSILGRF